MRRDDFEERYGSLEQEGFTPEECGLKPRRRKGECCPHCGEELECGCHEVRWVVLSPDRIPIAPMSYASREEALRALTAWCNRFVVQGYYASVAGRIPLRQLAERCFIELTREEFVDEDRCPECGGQSCVCE